MHSSKHRMEELGKELTRSCEGRNKTIVPKMIRKQGIAFCKEMVFLYTHLAGNFYPHPFFFFQLVSSITMIFSLYIFTIFRLILSQGPLVEEDIATTTRRNYFLK